MKPPKDLEGYSPQPRMHKNQAHEWHENLSRDEGGGKRYTRARLDHRGWRFLMLEPGFEDWQLIEAPGIPEFVALRDVLFRKYQRKRVPHKFVEQVDEILAKLGYDPAALDAEDPEQDD